MNDRIKAVRKDAKITQADFGERIGVRQNTVALYESGQREPLDAVIKSICREFDVDEVWLRTGEGQMHRPLSRSDELAAIMGAAMAGRTPHDRLIQAIAGALAPLTDEQALAVVHSLQEIVDKFNAE